MSVAYGLERCECGSKTVDIWVRLKDCKYVGVAQGLDICDCGSRTLDM